MGMGTVTSGTCIGGYYLCNLVTVVTTAITINSFSYSTYMHHQAGAINLGGLQLALGH
jgi:hypothetical protein